MPETFEDLRPAPRTRTRSLDLAFADLAQDIPAPFTLEWLFDHVEGRTSREAK